MTLRQIAVKEAVCLDCETPHSFYSLVDHSDDQSVH